MNLKKFNINKYRCTIRMIDILVDKNSSMPLKIIIDRSLFENSLKIKLYASYL